MFTDEGLIILRDLLHCLLHWGPPEKTRALIPGTEHGGDLLLGRRDRVGDGAVEGDDDKTIIHQHHVKICFDLPCSILTNKALIVSLFQIIFDLPWGGRSNHLNLSG